MANKGSSLTIGKYLGGDDYLLSNNGKYVACMQDDGNFVLYHATSTQPPGPDWGRPYWASNTAGAGQSYTVIQEDGNFVLYHGSDPTHPGAPSWASNTVLGSGQYCALLQDDGDFVLCHGSDPTQPGTPYWTAFPQVMVEKKFMQNYRVASAVNGGNDVVAVRKSSGQTELFAIGSDGNVHNFYADPASETGFSEATITTGLQVKSLAAGLDSQGRTVVLAACKPGPSLYYVVEDTTSPTRWGTQNKLFDLLVPQGVIDIARIIVQEIAGNLYVALLWTTGNNLYTMTYAIWQTDAPVFLSPQNMFASADLNCIWLGNTAQNATFANFPTGKIYLYTISTQQPTYGTVTAPVLAMVSVDTAIDSTGNNQTFAILADQNAYRLVKNPDQGGVAQYSWVQLDQGTPTDQRIPFQQVVVEADSAGVPQVFTVSTPRTVSTSDPTSYNVLYHWIEEAGSQTGYAFPPTPIHKSVGMHPGGVLNNAGTIEFFTVAASNQVTHLFQEQASHNWVEQIVETSTGDIEEYASYGTDVTIYDHVGALLINSAVTIWASEQTRITVNGSTFFIDAYRPAPIMTNTAGMLSIAQETDSLAIPSLQFTVPALMLSTESIAIQPSADVQNQLATVSSNDLMNATVADDSYLLADEYRTTGNTTSMAEAINACMGLVGTAPLGATTHHSLSRHGSKRGVWHRSAGSAADLRKIAPPKVKRHWQLSFEGNKVIYRALTHHEASALMAEQQASLPAVTGAFDWLSDIGDALKGVVEGIAEVFSIVVDGVNAAITLVINGVKYLFDAVIELVEQAFDMVELIFAQMKAFFEMIFEWLAWLFKWKDILRCHDALAYTINQFLGFLQGSASGIQSLVDSGFSVLQDQIASLFDQAVSIAGQSTVGSYEQSNDPHSADYSSALSNNFVYNEFINNAGSASLSTSLLAAFEADTDPVNAFLQQLTDFASTIEGSSAFGDALTYFQNLGGSPDQIFTQLLAGLFRVVQGIVQVGLSAVQALVDALLQLISTAVGALQTMLNETWNIPFVSQFYSWITNGSTLTTLDLIALIVAIPTTLFYKIYFNASPFPDSTSLNDFTSAFDSQLMLQAAGFATAGAGMLSEEPPVITLSDEAATVMASFYLVSMVIGGFLTNISDQMAPKASLVLTISTLVLSGGAFACSFPWFTSPGTLSCETKVGLDMWTYIAASLSVVLGAIYIYVKGWPGMPSNDTMAVVLTAYGGLSLSMATWSTWDEAPLVQAGRIIPTIPPLAKLLRHSSVIAATAKGSTFVLGMIDILCYYTAGGIGFALFKP